MRFELADGSGLTRNQFLLWLGQAAAAELPVLNELVVFVFDGVVDRRFFGEAVQIVVDKSDALRTVVNSIDGMPRAEVLPRLICNTAELDLSGNVDPDAQLDSWSRSHVDSMLDLSQGSFKSTLIKLSETSYAWSLLQHHVMTDAVSIVLFMQRVGECYERLVAGESTRDVQYPQYAAYIDFELESRKSGDFATRQAYWEARTDTDYQPIVFYGGRSLRPDDGLHRERLVVGLGAERSSAIREFAGRRGVRRLSEDFSLFSIFIAALGVYLFRLSGQQTIAIGVPWQNRPRAFRETIGLFVEQDPFVLSVEAGDSFMTLLKKVHAEALGSMRHLPYSAGNAGGKAYDAGLNYVKASAPPFSGFPVRTLAYRPSYGDASLNLLIHDFDRSGDFSLAFEFNSSLFNPVERRVAIDHFLNSLTACLEHPERDVGSVKLLTAAERASVASWNDTTRPCAGEQTVVGLFEAQVIRTPGATALVHEGQSITYDELNRRAGRLAGELMDQGVSAGVLVGVCMDRSPELLVAVLAILKARGAYVALDPSFPRDRLAYMAQDAALGLVLTSSGTRGLIGNSCGDVTEMEVTDSDDRAVEDSVRWSERTGTAPVPDDLAYVSYTSGSTGRPKGVEVPHGALVNFLDSMRREPGCTQQDVLLAVTTLSFDIAGLELFLPLVCGGRVVLASREVASDGRRLALLLEQSAATIVQATPATWRLLIEGGWCDAPGLKVLCGGEGLPMKLAHQLLERGVELWNLYGPTETTIWSTAQRIDKDDPEIGIGWPIANTRCYVVDDALRQLPPGIPGELLIGGAGLARGYRNRPELTAERFPFLPDDGEPAAGTRVYRTGDLVRQQPDGRLVHLGRLDHQVKINGFRIELGEIEARLDTHPGVRSSVVLAQDALEPTASLAAFVVKQESAVDLTVSELRAHLTEILPNYMIPASFVFLDDFPTTPNGKVDRLALLALEQTQASPASRYVAPRTDTEKALVQIWERLLRRQPVGVQDSFFDLGGQSLVALQIVNGIRQQLTIDIPLQTLFDKATIESLAMAVDALGSQQRSSASEPVPLTRRKRTAVSPRTPHKPDQGATS